MKIFRWGHAASALALLLAGAIAQRAEAQPGPGQRGFWCHTARNQPPTTMYQNSEGQREPWIRWVSDHFGGSGYDPLTRCREVSSRLETYRLNHQLNYVTVGRMNNQNVICTASENNGRCEGLIFTLRPNTDPIQTLYNFMAWREGQAATPSLYESGAVPYIYVGDRIEQGDSTPETVQPEPEPSAAPQPPANTDSKPPLREL